MPSFLTLSDDGLLTFGKISESMVGEYDIILRTEINTQTPEYTLGSVKIRVIIREKEIILPPKDVKMYLKNQELRVGSSFFYELPKVFNYKG